MPTVRSLLRRSSLRFAFLVLFLTLPLTAILAFRFVPGGVPSREGVVASQTIKSPARVSYISDLLTEEEREKAEAAVSDFLVYLPQVGRQQQEKLVEIDRSVRAIVYAPERPEPERRKAVEGIGIGLSQKANATILAASISVWQGIFDESSRLLRQLYDTRIPTDALAQTRERIVERIDPSLSTAQASVVAELVTGLLRPNVVVDEQQTAVARSAARQAVQPVAVTVEKGETILRDGEVVQALHLEKLAAVGLLDAPIAWRDVAGIVLLLLTINILFATALQRFHPLVMENDRRLLLLASVIIATVLAAKLTIPGRDVWAMLFPLAAAPMVLATLLDMHLAVLATLLLSVLVPYAAQGTLEASDLQLVFVYLAGGLAGVAGVWRADRLYRFFLAGGAVAVASFAVIGAFWLVDQQFDPMRMGVYAFAALVNGLLSATLTIGVFILLGLLFGVTTTWHLLELAQPNHPLLRRLINEAPGTYHHSIIVANMAEQAAETIGANTLLARVGAYYHDIGKILRPGYFIENQLDSDNIHQRLDPERSAKMIVSHVTDGINLAKQYRLPVRVRDFIPEHHGTRLATYFYRTAVQNGASVDPELFRYPGPKPQSRETAIVMLADSVEAVIRSSGQHSPEEIDAQVERTVTERFDEGQLDDCPLTFRDLEKMKEAFMKVLRGVYHPRIEYPDAAEDETALARNRADQRDRA